MATTLVIVLVVAGPMAQAGSPAFVPATAAVTSEAAEDPDPRATLVGVVEATEFAALMHVYRFGESSADATQVFLVVMQEDLAGKAALVVDVAGFVAANLRNASFHGIARAVSTLDHASQVACGYRWCVDVGGDEGEIHLFAGAAYGLIAAAFLSVHLPDDDPEAWSDGLPPFRLSVTPVTGLERARHWVPLTVEQADGTLTLSVGLTQSHPRWEGGEILRGSVAHGDGDGDAGPSPEVRLVFSPHKHALTGMSARMVEGLVAAAGGEPSIDDVGLTLHALSVALLEVLAYGHSQVAFIVEL